MCCAALLPCLLDTHTDLLCAVCMCRRIIYHGAVSDVQSHFEAVGFSLPPRMDLPSWLVEITTPAGKLAAIHWVSKPHSSGTAIATCSHPG
jgi:hypothetical protein